VKLDIDFGKIIDLKDATKVPTFEKLKRTLLALMIRQKDLVFRSETDPDGLPWEKLSTQSLNKRLSKNRSTKDISKLNEKRIGAGLAKLSSHKILQSTGLLRNSLTQSGAPYSSGSVGSNEISLGTFVPYAVIHQYGGVIKNPGTDNGFGMGIKIKPYSITMPQRSFIGFGKQDDAESTELISSFIEKANK
jgi:phage gpG-like protein